uniref:Protein lsd1-like n=1 Tax=Tetraselmis sp. GSL018 TaxID=582737 RepID=A0A061RA73_9CHLO
MYRPPAQHPQSFSPQSQIVCSGCSTLLMYPQGATNVKCARCHHVTQTSEMAQLVCSGCCVLLMYPRGANTVQCSRCSTINRAMQAQSNNQRSQTGQIVCSGCRVTLVYSFGAQSVKCALCNCVTHVAANAAASSTGGAESSTAQGDIIPPRNPEKASAPKPAAVVVQNPSTIDDYGNEVQSISVGLHSGG